MEHLTINEASITFDFLGKDSMRYFETIEVRTRRALCAVCWLGPHASWPQSHTTTVTVRAIRCSGQASAGELPTLLQGQEANGGRVRQAHRAFLGLSTCPVGRRLTIMPCLQPTTLNKQLSEFMPGLSAKVFRTYNASVTLEKELPECDITKTTQEKVGTLSCMPCLLHGA